MGILEIADSLGLINIKKKKIENLLRQYKINDIIRDYKDGVDILIEIAESDNFELANRAIETLGKMKSQEAFETILAALQDERTLKTAISSLQTLGDVAALPYLLPFLKHHDPRIRKSTIAAVSRLKLLPGAESYIDEEPVETIALAQKIQDKIQPQTSEDEDELFEKTSILIDTGHGTHQDIIDKLMSLDTFAGKYGLSVEKGSISAASLSRSKIIFIAVPMSPFSEDDIVEIQQQVYNGSVLIILGSWTPNVDFSSVNEILKPIGMRIRERLVCVYKGEDESRQATFTFDITPFEDVFLFSGIKKLSFVKACAIDPGIGDVLLTAGLDSFADDNINMQPDEKEDKGLIPLIVTHTYGDGKVLLIGDYGILTGSDDSTLLLLQNILAWSVSDS